jgi:hypothetical protein
MHNPLCWPTHRRAPPFSFASFSVLAVLSMPHLGLMLAIAACVLSQVYALQASSNATCLADYAWVCPHHLLRFFDTNDPALQMNNKLGQSPCLVYAKLMSACLDIDYVLPSLTDDSHFYSTIGGTSPGDCECNEPVYNLISACAACQGPNRLRLRWTEWGQHCLKIYPTFKGEVPDDTQIPLWAQLSVEVLRIFLYSSRHLVNRL